MSTKGAAGTNRRNKDVKMAAAMAKAGVKRTTYRDPITYQIKPIGTYPGVKAGKLKG